MTITDCTNDLIRAEITERVEERKLPHGGGEGVVGWDERLTGKELVRIFDALPVASRGELALTTRLQVGNLGG